MFELKTICIFLSDKRVIQELRAQDDDSPARSSRLAPRSLSLGGSFRLHHAGIEQNHQTLSSLVVRVQ